MRAYYKIILVLAVFLFTCCQSNKLEEIEQSRFLMDTVVEIKVRAREDVNLDHIWKQARKLEKSLSVYEKGSEISLINKNAGIRSVVVSSKTVELFKKAISFSKMSGGMFDATIGPLIKLWAKAAKNKEVPDYKKIKKAMSRTSFKRINLRGNRIKLARRGMRVSMGGMAKGFIVDQISDMLIEQGIKTGMVNAGGDIRAFGDKTWSIGIQHPRKKDKTFAVIQLKNRSIATSGDYERFFEVNGKRYHHIFNPKTGYPADKSISATVITPNAVDADALATILFILGPEKGLKLLQTFENTDGIIIDPYGNVYTTPGIRDDVKLRKIAVKGVRS